MRTKPKGKVKLKTAPAPAVLEIEPRVAGIDVDNMSLAVTTPVEEVAGQVQ